MLVGLPLSVFGIFLANAGTREAATVITELHGLVLLALAALGLKIHDRITSVELGSAAVQTALKRKPGPA